MQYFDADRLEQLLDIPSTIEALAEGFRSDWVIPARHHHDFDNPRAGKPSTLLLMPAWEVGRYLGIKTIIVSPNNRRHQLPAIQGTYTLFDAERGLPLAQMDARRLTNLRTAAASALAATYLARPDARRLLMVGTGSLAPFLIAAHCAVRPIEAVSIWGRDFTKAESLARSLDNGQQTFTPVRDLPTAVSEADLISCATLSPSPLVFGEDLRPGQHLDLVGAYRPHMREADNEAVRRAQLFADTRAGASTESGDLAIPLAQELIQAHDIQADLFDLCRGHHPGRRDAQHITFFKSVGHALEDLAAAKLAYERWRAGTVNSTG
ncbi:MAG: ornithine cyclodeaminase family protein [Bacteroidota bacterium]